MCEYSLHAVATRPAEVGESLISSTFPHTTTRGFASENDPTMAVCLRPGTELAFENEVMRDDVPLNFHPAAIRALAFSVTPFGAG